MWIDTNPTAFKQSLRFDCGLVSLGFWKLQLFIGERKMFHSFLFGSFSNYFYRILYQGKKRILYMIGDRIGLSRKRAG